ncbi:polysaccharide pyruvyl transferase [Staphylococcus condimenti]|uniref:Polysaccharide pyruvyl transferase family protein n=1 Tax=Staphylococcus condimenti TaxID=70255 RepID=A0AB37GYD6_9STAP|nr:MULTISPECIES: polysaccharide pyruvyl transferase family protein [Staphylococcus]AMY06110.1 hypothetical protein A4G25_09310 [Staphylococcus condimenti]APR59988.1 hypothetical protein BTZ13_01710 [Staphylococcus condimenti]MDK8646047.1 polysaccharide pyruvyl transferase family protein [Staphylococcus condimenti]OFP04331.1 hypothetical protein HMPREF3007_06870 [Staphylococcus sp. HMSC065E08]PNZ59158.1 polysaccharide pyruvyl transferase [Staphylococcus condimenti]
MKRILIRSGMLPTNTYSEYDLLSRDRFGSNNGNLVYQNSIVRTLMTESVEILSDNYSSNPNNAKYINNNFDCYVIPLADAFRKEFIPTLKRYTQLINKLEIPVIVIGVGLKAPYSYDVKKGFEFDNEVKEFVKAVLNKSEIIGLRGKLTANYLESLGFIPEKDFTVIGCPSMYTFGRNLKIKEVNLNRDSRVSLNASNIATEKVMDFLNEIAIKYSNYFFVPQSYDEFLINYFGFGRVNDVPYNFPKNIGSKFYKEGKVKYFLNAKTWFDYIKTIDLSIGTRLHGNIVATINGTPSITIVHDARMRELAEFHALPSISAEDIQNYDSLIDLINDIDFKSVESIHPKRFDHFLNFLEKNNLGHIYREKKNVEKAPLDNLMEKINFEKPIDTITNISFEEKVLRLTKGFEIYTKRQKRLNQKK